MLLASSWGRPGMLLNILQGTGQPPTRRIIWARNFNSAEVEKPWARWNKEISEPEVVQISEWVYNSRQLWGEWSTGLGVHNLRMSKAPVIKINDIFKKSVQKKKSRMIRVSKFKIKTGSNRDGIWVEEVNIIFILITEEGKDLSLILVLACWLSRVWNCFSLKVTWFDCN